LPVSKEKDNGPLPQRICLKIVPRFRADRIIGKDLNDLIYDISIIFKVVKKQVGSMRKEFRPGEPAGRDGHGPGPGLAGALDVVPRIPHHEGVVH